MSNITPTSFNFIGESTELNGDLFIKGDTHIHGKVKGSITGDSSKTLIIEYTGQVEGDIIGINVIIQGQLLGNIINGLKVEANSNARIKGSISSKILEITPGAKIIGEIQSSQLN